MSPSGFARLFSMPSLAFLVAALIVAGCGYLVYRMGRARPAPAAERYWKRLSLVAEVCIAAGLAGLATFAGGMKISSDHQLLEHRVQLSQAALGERFRITMVENCEVAGQRRSAPYNPATAKKDLCATARAYVNVNSPEIDWTAAEQSLRDFPLKYPGCVDNVFTRHSDCETPVDTALKLADAVHAAEQEKQSARADEPVAAMAPGGWGALVLTFLVAAIGVAIKCARAAADVFPARAIRR
ncbi:MAG: hypothetical protein ABWY05_11110 [Noviherbaspirillum sp.]